MIKNFFTKVIDMIKCFWTLDGVECAPTYPMDIPFLFHHSYFDHLYKFSHCEFLIFPHDFYYKY